MPWRFLVPKLEGTAIFKNKTHSHFSVRWGPEEHYKICLTDIVFISDPTWQISLIYTFSAILLMFNWYKHSLFCLMHIDHSQRHWTPKHVAGADTLLECVEGWEVSKLTLSGVRTRWPYFSHFSCTHISAWSIPSMVPSPGSHFSEDQHHESVTPT